ncbi:MAG: N-acetylmuramoyl-L-alanine amidase [Bacteroidota bacterium]|jgi:N-acetylmuramoyl-L-alanine amidase
MQRLKFITVKSAKAIGFSVLHLLCVLVILLGLPGAKSVRVVNSLKTLVIDAGHGGVDPGCNGANEITEKQVTLGVALKLGKILADSMPEIKVVFTRTSDKTLKLSERPELANKNSADLFISIHCNANNNVSAAGSETYFMGLHKSEGNLEVAKRENSAITFESDYQDNVRYGGFDPNSPEGHIIFSLVQNAFMKQSLKLASGIENHTGKLSPIKSRGVKQAGFLVLWQTSMPSVLVETGFLTNSSDRKVLKTEEGQRKIAIGIYRAIRDYKIGLEASK